MPVATSVNARWALKRSEKNIEIRQEKNVIARPSWNVQIFYFSIWYVWWSVERTSGETVLVRRAIHNTLHSRPVV